MVEEVDSSIQELLKLDDEALLDELGERLLGGGPGFGPSDIEREARFAKSWLTQQADDFRSKICGDLWTKLEHDGGFDTLTDAALVADALEALLGRPTANIVAVILLRRGLRKLCAECE